MHKKSSNAQKIIKCTKNHQMHKKSSNAQKIKTIYYT